MNEFEPLKVLLSARSVVEAPPPPHPTQEVTVSAPMLAEAEKRLVEEAVVEKKLVVVALVVVERVMLSKILAPLKILLPEKVLESESKVDEAEEPPPQPVQEVTVSVLIVAVVRLAVAPVILPPVIVGLVNSPFSNIEVSPLTRASESESDCLVTVGRVSETKISSLRI